MITHEATHGTWELYMQNVTHSFGETRGKMDVYFCPYCKAEHVTAAGHAVLCPVCWTCGNKIAVDLSVKSSRESSRPAVKSPDASVNNPRESVNKPAESVNQAVNRRVDQERTKAPARPRAPRKLTPAEAAQMEKDTEEDIRRQLAEVMG